MGQKNQRKIIVIAFFLILFIGGGFFFRFSRRTFTDILGSGNKAIRPSQSSDPGNPHALYDDSSVYEYYNASTSYYYRTENASPSRYHVVWLQPQDALDNFDLYLYNDSGYSDLEASSTRGAGFLDWVVFRPNVSQYLYARVNTLSSSGGFAFIEWEDSSNNLAVENSVSNSLSAPDSLELYQIFLSNTSAYRFRLDVPSEGDFDLYLYRLDPGAGANSLGYAAYSWSLGLASLK